MGDDWDDGGFGVGCGLNCVYFVWCVVVGILLVVDCFCDWFFDCCVSWWYFSGCCGWSVVWIGWCIVFFVDYCVVGCVFGVGGDGVLDY